MGPRSARNRSPEEQRRRRRRALLLAAVVGGGVAAAVVARRRHQHLLATTEDECGPDPRLLPDGRSMTVDRGAGVELAVTVAGPDDGPTVVLAHCWMGSRAVWATTARLLAAEGFRVVLYDQRGHGESTINDDPLTIDGLGDDLRAVIEATGTEGAVLVGHSMGGMTVQSYAGRHPDHFRVTTRGVVLVATAARTLGRALPVGVAERLFGDTSPAWTRQGPFGRRMARGALGRVAHPSHVEVTLEGLVTTKGIARAGFLEAMAPMDLRPALEVIDVPTVVMVGSRDRLTPPSRARELAGAVAGAELVVLPYKGHMLPLEAPRAIVDAVKEVAGQHAVGAEPARRTG